MKHRYGVIAAVTTTAVIGLSTVVTGTVVADGASATTTTPNALRCHGHAATIVGTDAADVVQGTPGPDVIVAGDGGDTIRAGRGDDIICAGKGRDEVNGGRGDDILLGGPDAGKHVVVTYVSRPPRFISRLLDKRKTFVPHK